MVTITSRPVTRVIVRGDSTTVVQSKPSGNTVRVVQTVSPIPGGNGSVPDPGDLRLWFENQLV